MNEPRNGRKTGTDGQPREGSERATPRRPRLSRRRLLHLTSLGIAGGIVGASPAAARSLPNVLTIEGTGPRATYEFSVSGDLAKTTANGANLNGNDHVTGSSASGVVGAGADSYAFSGDLLAFDYDGTLQVLLNGEPAHVGTRADHVLTIEGTGPRATYEFSVSSDLAKTTANGANLNGNDHVSGSSASGVVGAGADSYAFSGDLTDFSLDGDAEVFLDGDPLDPTRFLGHVLTIEGTGSRATYEFSVSGDLAKTTANGANINGNDGISGSSASGVVGAGADSYAFSGGLNSISLDGDAEVFLDGDPLDPTPDNILTIEGTGPRATYEFTVSGLLEKTTANGANLNGNDHVTGSSASGIVGAGADSYAFSGGLTDFSLDGDADVFLNGDRLDVGQPAETLTFASDGGRFAYEFTVTGALEKSDAMGASIDDNDSISGKTATGQGGDGGVDSYAFSGELVELDVEGDATVYRNGEPIDPGLSPLLGVHSGLSDADFGTIDRIEAWQNTPYAVQTLFVPWNPDEGHMDWLFDHVLPKIWNAGRVPLITWEPFTPDAQSASVNTDSLVKRGSYDVYLADLAGTTSDDIEVRIANGEYDRYIERWTGRLREWLAGPDGVSGTGDDRRAYLRLAHEMNSDWYPWSPTVGNSSASDYVEMWRHVHSRFADAGIGSEHLQWMWCVNAEDVGSYTAEELYPGDSSVDWLSIDGYQWGESKAWSDWDSPEEIFGDMLERVRTLADKPVCVAETASTSETSSGYDPARKAEWIRSAFEYFDDEGVELWCWFNEDKETDWAMFDGARGTETVTFDGESLDAYAAYRQAVDAYAATRAMGSGPMTTAAFTGER